MPNQPIEIKTPPIRKLAAILFVDIAGYTSLMQSDEGKAMKNLNKFKLELETRVPTAQGDIIQFYGDGCLVVFNNAADAVSCSMALQRSFQTYPEVPVRVGIHLGDVLFKDNNVFGDSVNLASRIESMGIPGAVLFSSNVRNQIKNNALFQIESLGSFEFKNVLEPMDLFAIANEGFLVPKREEMQGKLKETSLNKSIAVLPFSNMSGNPEEEYFSDGVTEEIIHSLAQLKELKVVGRTSAFSFKGKNIDIREVGQTLNVSTILEGSIRKAGNRIRITAQLIKVADGFHLWSERYDRELTDIFEVQDEIAKTIAEKLKVTLFGLPTSNSTPKTQNMEAYQLYLKGRYFQSKRLESYPKALQYFEEALELDPDFALAHYGIGITYFYMAGYGMIAPRVGYPKAKEAALKVLELDSGLAVGFMLLGATAFIFDWDWERAIENMNKGLAINPGEVEFYKGLTMMNLVKGNIKKAISFANKATEVEPINPDARIELCYCYLKNNDYNESLRVAEEMIELDPNYNEAYRLKGLISLKLNEIDKAISYIEKASEMAGGEGFAPFYLAILAANQGQFDQARNMLNGMLEQSKKTYVSALFVACIYGALGEMDEAFNWLEKAYEEKDGMLLYINIEPAFEVFHSDLRYNEYVKRLKFVK